MQFIVFSMCWAVMLLFCSMNVDYNYNAISSRNLYKYAYVNSKSFNCDRMGHNSDGD